MALYRSFYPDVIQSPKGDVIADATVKIYPLGTVITDESEEIYSFITDEDGWWDWSTIKPAWYEMSVDGDNVEDGPKYFTLNASRTTDSQTQILVASDTISCDTSIVRVYAASGITMVSTPTIDPGQGNQMLVIMGAQGTADIRLQDKSNLSGGNINLGGQDFILGPGDACALNWDPESEEWYRLVRADN